MKRPNLRMTSVPETVGENGTKLENTLQDIIQENFPNLARHANTQIQEIQRTPQRYSSRRATPRHIIISFTKIEMRGKNVKGSQRERSGYPQWEIYQTNSGSLRINPTRREWGPIFNTLREFSTQNFSSSKTKIHKRRSNKILCRQANAEKILSQ